MTPKVLGLLNHSDQRFNSLSVSVDGPLQMEEVHGSMSMSDWTLVLQDRSAVSSIQKELRREMLLNDAEVVKMRRRRGGSRGLSGDSAMVMGGGAS